MPDDLFESTERESRAGLIRVRATPAERKRALELARSAGYDNTSAYIRAFLAREDAASTNEGDRP